MQETRNIPEEKHLNPKVLCKVLSISHVPLGWRRTFLAQGKKSSVLRQPDKNHSRVGPNTWHSSLSQFFGKKFRAAAMLSVFTVSAAVHEYVLSICFGFFYPVLFCLFSCFGGKFQGRECGSGCGVCGFFRRACFVLLIMMMLFLQHLHTVLLPKGCNCESKLCEWIFAAQ